MKNVEPISPNQVTELKKSSVPPQVIESFNELIVKGWSNGESYVAQKDVVQLIVSKLNKDEMFDYNWLNVEDVFRAKGWEVHYDKPGYNESYGAVFKFSIPF